MCALKTIHSKRFISEAVQESAPWRFRASPQRGGEYVPPRQEWREVRMLCSLAGFAALLAALFVICAGLFGWQSALWVLGLSYGACVVSGLLLCRRWRKHERTDIARACQYDWDVRQRMRQTNNSDE